jgi:hypothetical protein
MKRKVSLLVLLALGYSMALGMSCLPNVSEVGAGPRFAVGLVDAIMD